MDYTAMTKDELTNCLVKLTVEFDEYKPIYVEAYTNMVRISEEANKIKEELNKR